MLLFLLSSPLYAHKYYVSTVNMDKEGDTLRVEMSVFYDDMELAIYELYPVSYIAIGKSSFKYAHNRR